MVSNASSIIGKFLASHLQMAEVDFFWDFWSSPRLLVICSSFDEISKEYTSAPMVHIKNEIDPLPHPMSAAFFPLIDPINSLMSFNL